MSEWQPMRDWNDWIAQLISSFRDQAARVLPEQRLRISNLDDLSSPCQVDVVWLQNTPMGLDLQLLIIQHFEDRPDLQVSVHGPVPFTMAISQFDQILTHEKWKRPLTSEDMVFVEDGERSVARILGGSFLSAFDDLRNYVMQSAFADVPRIAHIPRKTRVTQHCCVWTAYGDIRSIDPTVLVSKDIGEAVACVTHASPSAPPEPKPALTAYGTFFYPAIWVGELPKLTFEEKARKQHVHTLAKKTFTLDCAGIQAVVREDGLAAITVDSKAKALDMLNVIMGMAVVSGLPCFAVREPEVGEILLDPKTMEIKGSTMSLVSDRTKLGSWFEGGGAHPLPVPRNIISEDDLRNLFKNAGVIFAQPEAKALLLFLLEAYTHFQSSEYPQSFVMAWTVVEKYTALLWRDFLGDRAVPKDRRGKLRNVMSWTTDHVLETLELANAMDREQYQSLMSLKAKRNKILHEGRTTVKEDAQECLRMACQIVVSVADGLNVLCTINPRRKLLGLPY